MLMLMGDLPPATNPLIETVIEIQQEEVEPEPKVYTIEEKIERNHYECDEATQYIRADNAKCLDKPVYTPPATQRAVRQAPVQSKSVSSAGNTYEAGQCVWYIKNLRPEIPNGWGSAYQWLGNARASGWATGSKPRVGAVGTRGNHVVLITKVNKDGTVNYTDMNGRWIAFEVGYGTKPANYYTYIY